MAKPKARHLTASPVHSNDVIPSVYYAVSCYLFVLLLLYKIGLYEKEESEFKLTYQKVNRAEVDLEYVTRKYNSHSGWWN